VTIRRAVTSLNAPASHPSPPKAAETSAGTAESATWDRQSREPEIAPPAPSRLRTLEAVVQAEPCCYLSILQTPRRGARKDGRELSPAFSFFALR
jgi:hypothetical protein